MARINMQGSSRNDKDTEILGELRESLNELHGMYATEYDRCREELYYESGDQWRGTKREPSRVTLTLNLTRSYVERVVNPYVLNPVSIKVDVTKDPHTKIVKAFIGDIESKSGATEAYQTTFRNAVACGRGFLHVGTYYANEQTLDQNISIDAIADPLSCYLGPHNKIDGSDANYGVYDRRVDKKSSVNKYGPEVAFDTLGVYDNWNNKDDGKIPSILFYKIKETKKKRQFQATGEYVDQEEPLEATTQTRYIFKRTCTCYHIIGEKIISSTEYDMPYVPIIPTYGDRIFTRNGMEYSGITYKTMGVNTQINYSASSEAELIALAPKAPWMATANQVANNKEMWRNANTRTYDTLIYEPETIEGHMVGPPTRADNTAQTQGIAQSKQGSITDMSRVTGMFDSMMGQYDTSVTSGAAHKSISSMGEISTAQYSDNLEKSMIHLGRVILHLMNNVYDTPRVIDIDGQEVVVNFKELGINPDEFGVDVYTGPSVESKKQEAITTLQEMMQYNPQASPVLSVRLAENLNVPNKDKIVADLKKLLPPELRDEDDEQGIPPEAQQALQSAQQAIEAQTALVEEAKSIIANMQTQLISDNADRASDMELKRLDSLTTLTKAKLDSYTKLQTEAMKLNTQADTSGIDNIVDEAEATIHQETNEELQDIAQDIGGIVEQGNIDPMQQTEKVGGPVDAMGPIDNPEAVENIEDILMEP
jgi:hypothetical protein